MINLMLIYEWYNDNLMTDLINFKQYYKVTTSHDVN